MEKFFNKLKDKSVGLIALCVGVLFSFVYFVCSMIERDFSFSQFLLIAIEAFIYVAMTLSVRKDKKGLAFMWLFVLFGLFVYNFFIALSNLEEVIEYSDFYDGAGIAFFVMAFFLNLFVFATAVLTVLNQYGIKIPFAKDNLGFVLLGACVFMFVNAILCCFVDSWFLLFDYVAKICYFVILYTVVDMTYGEKAETEKVSEPAKEENPTETPAEETPIETPSEESVEEVASTEEK